MELSAPALWINQTFNSFDVGITTFIHKLQELAGPFFTPFFASVRAFSMSCFPSRLLYHKHIGIIRRPYIFFYQFANWLLYSFA